MAQNKGVSLSSVDMLACALGACIVLMLVFVVNVGNSSGNGTKSGEKFNGTSLSLFSHEISEGKMVFIRQVALTCQSIQDFKLFKKNMNVGVWNYDQDLKALQLVDEQVYFVPEEQMVVYSILSDAVISNQIKFTLNKQILRKNPTMATRSVRVKAKLIEGAAAQNSEKVFSGFYETLPNTYGTETGFKNLTVTFKKRALKNTVNIQKLIEINNY
ncbi:hypothetical protein P8625_15690 [Tenacibaculum tangerinum]|uniref:Gliding motility-associated protein GldM C-terminal domain-containing protein n=1 Tax=Tenacibaculum tangerinum TaxID=3038772 RepID=A0ABY8L217_9FLAO|nr:hypothetical protein [Tenacibaculum tangerinum]WGH75487.1 hypothetical protein P8625_15690 [Tenacibaculum tangerinum]